MKNLKTDFTQKFPRKIFRKEPVLDSLNQPLSSLTPVENELIDLENADFFSDGDRSHQLLFNPQSYNGQVQTRLDLISLPFFDRDIQKNRQGISNWLHDQYGLDLDNPESIEYFYQNLNSSINFLEKDLRVRVPEVIIQKIRDVEHSKSSILNLYTLAQRYSSDPVSSKLTAVTWALLTTWEAVNYYNRNKVKFGDLSKKARNFEKHLWDSFQTENQLEQHTFRSGSLKGIGFRPIETSLTVGAETRNVEILNFSTGSKGKYRIIGKMLEKPEKNIDTVIKDGIRSRIIIAEKDKEFFAQWMESQGFSVKNRSNADAKKGDIYLTASVNAEKLKKSAEFLPEADENKAIDIEIQVTTVSDLNESEAGVFDHRVYRAIQNFEIFCRLFQSISSRRFEEAIDRLSRELEINPSEIRERFEKHFYPTEDGKRWLSFGYVSRLGQTGLIPPGYFEAMLVFFRGKILSIVSPKASMSERKEQLRKEIRKRKVTPAVHITIEHRADLTQPKPAHKETVRIIPIRKNEETGEIEILMLQKSPDSKQPYALEFPGGKVDLGETNVEAAQKELVEETGIEKSAENLESVEKTEYTNTATKQLTKVEYFITKIQNDTKIAVDQTINPDGGSEDKHIGHQWIPLKKILKLMRHEIGDPRGYISNNSRLASFLKSPFVRALAAFETKNSKPSDTSSQEEESENGAE